MCLEFLYKNSLSVPEEELQAAEEKFDESKELSCNSMMNFMESDVSAQGVFCYCSALLKGRINFHCLFTFVLFTYFWIKH